MGCSHRDKARPPESARHTPLPSPPPQGEGWACAVPLPASVTFVAPRVSVCEDGPETRATVVPLGRPTHQGCPPCSCGAVAALSLSHGSFTCRSQAETDRPPARAEGRPGARLGTACPRGQVACTPLSEGRRCLILGFQALVRASTLPPSCTPSLAGS